jgi:signal transduction histidine kinase
MKLWKAISNVGINEHEDALNKTGIIVVNRVSAIMWGLCFLSLCINLILGVWVFVPVLSLVLILLLLTYFFNRKTWYTAGKLNMFVLLILLLLFMSFKGAYGAGLEYYFLTLMILPIIIFQDKRIIYPLQVVCMGCLILLKFYAFTPETSSLPHKIFYIFNSIGSSLLIILAIIFYKNIVHRNQLEILRKSEIIEDKNRQLDTFSYSVSHDLKAPLRALEGYSEILIKESGTLSEEERKRMLTVIAENVIKMRTMIDDLLKFSKTAKQEMRPEQIDMNVLVKEVIGDLRQEKNAHKVKFLIKDLAVARADRSMMKHAMSNLISNAIKYTRLKADPEIEIGMINKEGEEVYFVKDNGIGFNMDYSAKLFNTFQRLHSSKDYEGTGIGLSIVRNIIQRHGGKVWAEAKENEGASFYFTLPRKEN